MGYLICCNTNRKQEGHLELSSTPPSFLLPAATSKFSVTVAMATLASATTITERDELRILKTVKFSHSLAEEIFFSEDFHRPSSITVASNRPSILKRTMIDTFPTRSSNEDFNENLCGSPITRASSDTAMNTHANAGRPITQLKYNSFDSKTFNRLKKALLNPPDIPFAQRFKISWR